MLAHERKVGGAELLFLHGWGSNKDIFKLADKLKGFSVTRVDFYGFGDTPSPPYPVNLDYYVQAVDEIMRFYNMEDVVVIGHSFGGRVAIKLASNSRVSALVLVDSAGIKPKRTAGYFVKVGVYKLLKKMKIATSLGSADYKKLTGSMKRTFVNVVNEDLSGLTKKIDIPTMIIWGEKDRETPMYMMRKLEKNIEKHVSVVFENCGHFCFLEEPTRFYSLITEFARGAQC